MDISLEQFIPSNKSKSGVYALKYGGIGLFVIDFAIIIQISILIAFIALIVSIALIVYSYFWYVDYEYEFYDKNIDVSKIYGFSKRKLAQKIDFENVVSVYESSKANAGSNGEKRMFNSNINNLNIYTFVLKDKKKIQLALNEKMEKYVKIAYMSKMNM